MVNEISTRKEILTKTSEKINKIFNESIETSQIKLNEVFDYFDLIKNWFDLLNNYDASVVLDEASYSLLSSIHIAFSGFYREAYLSLRCTLESASYFIFFVDNNYSFLKWKKNIININWSSLKNEEKGVLSKKYLMLFDKKANVAKLLDEVENIYRICSEYVHGKYDFMFIKKFNKISFNKQSLQEFLDIYMNTVRVINSLMCIRFNKKVSYIKTEYKEIVVNECKRYNINYLEE